MRYGREERTAMRTSPDEWEMRSRESITMTKKGKRVVSDGEQRCRSSSPLRSVQESCPWIRFPLMSPADQQKRALSLFARLFDSVMLIRNSFSIETGSESFFSIVSLFHSKDHPSSSNVQVKITMHDHSR